MNTCYKGLALFLLYISSGIFHPFFSLKIYYFKNYLLHEKWLILQKCYFFVVVSYANELGLEINLWLGSLNDAQLVVCTSFGFLKSNFSWIFLNFSLGEKN